ncbi:hypothetical protein N665_0978s0005 [Sinapis alba]|nr:hypothetical protein N665_0978s0005 [Sinapis alba]
MLVRLASHEYYCFLGGYLGFFHIPIHPDDQEKTTFTCPYGTFVYRRMPFKLCNALATFQRCMMLIFTDMIEDFMEVFMDDFSGHKVSAARIELGKAKIEVMTGLLPPAIVKDVRSSLGHAGFLRRFIKDFSKIARPLTTLLCKKVRFDFTPECLEVFKEIKSVLVYAPIVQAPY